LNYFLFARNQALIQNFIGVEGCPEQTEAASLRDSLYCTFSGIGSTVLFVRMIRIFEGGHLEMSAARSGVTEELRTAYVHEIFKNLESGDGKGFFDHLWDELDWRSV
jgi:dihydrofolate reductase